MWNVIENSYFWLCYSHMSKQLTLRFLRPLKKQVVVWRLSFSQEVVDLQGDYSIEEKISNLSKLKRQAEQIINNKKTSRKELDKAIEELIQLDAKLKDVKKQHKLA